MNVPPLVARDALRARRDRDSEPTAAGSAHAPGKDRPAMVGHEALAR
ncbi:hypothetical protein [Streptomyces sp. NBC_01264]|nr:hypothetical protein [Streptomyces sp. NBC_01264]MCX4775949.1 hypothetical protein [Streptomyces sp. NBC_01264]